MVFDADGDLLEADDGGIYRRTEPRSTDGSWFSLNSNLQVTEAHDTSYDKLSQIIITGNQDTGTSQQRMPLNVVWDALQNGDGGDVAVDTVTLAANAQSIRYSSFQFLSALRRRTYDVNNQQLDTVFPDLTVIEGRPFSGQFNTPLVPNQLDPSRLILGGADGTYESFDLADTIAEIGPDITINRTEGRCVGYGSLGNEDLLFVGSGEQIFRRTNLGDPLTALTLPTSGTIADLALDATDPANLFYIVSGGVFRSNDAGVTFSDITNDLDLPKIDRLRSMLLVNGPSFDALFVGGNRGVAVSTSADGFSTWTDFSGNVPNTPVYEFDYDPDMDTLIIGTLGRGTFSVFAALASIDVQPDTDGDGVVDSVDNCTLAINPDQRDTNGDGFGNVCDADLNNDGTINAVDLGLLRAVFFSADEDADFNGDGIVNIADLGVMRASFFGAPGPSGLNAP